MRYYDYIVVGSSFSAFPAVQRLIQKKKKFAVVDIGQKIDNELSNMYLKKSWKYIEKNRSQLIYKLNKLQSSSSVKLSYGSKHSYFFSRHSNNLSNSDFDKYYSKSLGGFSNNWGGVLYLYNSDELKNWPITKNKFYQDLDEVGKNFKIDKQLIKELTDNDQEIKKTANISKMRLLL